MISYGLQTPLTRVKFLVNIHHPTHHPSANFLASYTTLLFWPGRLPPQLRGFIQIPVHYFKYSTRTVHENSLQREHIKYTKCNGSGQTLTSTDEHQDMDLRKYCTVSSCHVNSWLCVDILLVFVDYLKVNTSPLCEAMLNSS